ncbi:MAG: hypothetical protein ABIZ91_13380, partial [Gemmatimonadaceae bacterium]
LAGSPDGVSQIVEGRRAGGRFHFTLATPNTPLIASVELTDSVQREAARRREGLRALLPTDGRGTVLSDVLLYEAPRDADARLEDVLARALGSSEVTRGSRLGAYWELQRTRARADTVTYTLTVMPKAAGWLRRLAGRVGLAERTAPVHMRFSEPLGDEVRTFRALALDVTRLGTGRYDVRLRAETGHGEWGESEREIRVVR